MYLQNREQNIMGFFISLITYSPESPLNGALPLIISNKRIPNAQISIL